MDHVQIQARPRFAPYTLYTSTTPNIIEHSFISVVLCHLTCLQYDLLSTLSAECSNGNDSRIARPFQACTVRRRC